VYHQCELGSKSQQLFTPLDDNDDDENKEVDMETKKKKEPHKIL
jgi:hypothetical protein